MDARNDDGGRRTPVLIVDGFSPFPESTRILEERFATLGWPYATVRLNLALLRRLRDMELFARRVVLVGEELREREQCDRFAIAGYSAGCIAALYAVKRLGLGKRVPRMAAFGAPFHGSWVSWPALATLPISRIAVQLLPDSDFLRGLHHDPLPKGFRMLCIAAQRDRICPPSTATLAGSAHKTVPTGHLGLLGNLRAFRHAAEFLDFTRP